MKKINIALVGLGQIGNYLLNELNKKKFDIELKTGKRINIVAISAKNINPNSNVILISGDGAFLSGGLSIEAAFQENKPIIVVIDNNGGLDCISQQQERMFESGKHFATDFRDIPFHTMFEGLGGYGELVTKREQLIPALKRAIESGKTACINVKAKGVISPIVAAVSDRRDKASIE